MHGPEALESAGILDELPGATGVILWQSLRDVTLWAGTPVAERAQLFSPAAERNRIATLLATTVDAELEPSLGMITAMVGQPGRVSAERVAIACRRIAQWAENHGHLATALAFAQAGAVTCPGNAAAAFKVGQIARRRAEYVRAETWFRRSIALGRQEGDWTSYALSFVGLGNLYLQRGNSPAARRFHLRGLRAANRHALHDIQGRALHDLHVIATVAGQIDEAQEYAAAALEAYGARHIALPALAHDVAYAWLTHGYFKPALSVFRALLPHLGTRDDRFIIYSSIARAGGGAGDRRAFEQGWSAVWHQSDAVATTTGFAEALLELARGATSLGLWDEAVGAAERAREIACARREARTQFAADAVLESISSERVALVVPVIADGTDQQAVSDPAVEALAQSFVASLAECAVVDA